MTCRTPDAMLSTAQNYRPGEKLYRQHIWQAPLLVDGKEIALRGYPRWDNPNARVNFAARRFAFELKGRRLGLDFKNGVRSAG